MKNRYSWCLMAILALSGVASAQPQNVLHIGQTWNYELYRRTFAEQNEQHEAHSSPYCAVNAYVCLQNKR